MKSSLIIFLFSINSLNTFSQWEIVTPYPQLNDLNTVFFSDINNGWAAGSSGTILHTNNAGTNWAIQNSTTTETLYSIDFINSNTGWCVGSLGQVLKTVNGGNDWNLIDTLPMGDFVYGVDFFDQNNGWAAEFFGKICHTTDGGENWVVQLYEQMYWLWSISFPNQTHGWAVGLNTASQEGIIINTTDGGANWSLQYNLYQRPFYFVQFIDANDGWVVGSYGTILHTTNGGINWSAQASGSANNLYSVNFVDLNIGWACGMNGKILHTTNGGNLWEEQVSGTDKFIFSILFTDSNNGWAVGQEGIMLHTTNGGVTDVVNEEPNIISFELNQNYPNPFNPSTTISWQLPIAGDVTLKIFNTLGEEITALVNDEYQDAGAHSSLFIVNSSLPSGIYFYQLKAGELISTKKMILLK